MMPGTVMPFQAFPGARGKLILILCSGHTGRATDRSLPTSSTRYKTFLLTAEWATSNAARAESQSRPAHGMCSSESGRVSTFPCEAALASPERLRGSSRSHCLLCPRELRERVEVVIPVVQGKRMLEHQGSDPHIVGRYGSPLLAQLAVDGGVVISGLFVSV